MVKKIKTEDPNPMIIWLWHPVFTLLKEAICFGKTKIEKVSGELIKCMGVFSCEKAQFNSSNGSNFAKLNFKPWHQNSPC